MFEGVTNAIPELLLYVIPGYVMLRIIERFSLAKRKDSFNTLLYSVLYSFIINIIVSTLVLILRCIITGYNSLSPNVSELIYQSMCIVFSVVISLIIIKTSSTSIGKKVFHYFNPNLEQYPNVWVKALLSEKGAWAKVYLDDETVYFGELTNYTSDPNDDRQELLLEAYKKYERSNIKGTVIERSVEDYEDKRNHIVLLERSHITAIEVTKQQ